MTISKEAFKSLVEAATRDRYKIIKVVVYDYTLRLTLKARRYTYDVSATYDPGTGAWAMYDIYQGNTIRLVVDEIDRLMKG